MKYKCVIINVLTIEEKKSLECSSERFVLSRCTKKFRKLHTEEFSGSPSWETLRIAGGFWGCCVCVCLCLSVCLCPFEQMGVCTLYLQVILRSQTCVVPSFTQVWLREINPQVAQACDTGRVVIVWGGSSGWNNMDGGEWTVEEEVVPKLMSSSHHIVAWPHDVCTCCMYTICSLVCICDICSVTLYSLNSSSHLYTRLDLSYAYISVQMFKLLFLIILFFVFLCVCSFTFFYISVLYSYICIYILYIFIFITMWCYQQWHNSLLGTIKVLCYLHLQKIKRSNKMFHSHLYQTHTNALRIIKAHSTQKN